jgi:hypothetical protein
LIINAFHPIANHGTSICLHVAYILLVKFIKAHPVIMLGVAKMILLMVLFLPDLQPGNHLLGNIFQQKTVDFKNIILIYFK